MPLTIDFRTSIVGISSPDTTVDAQTLADFIEDHAATPEAFGYDDPILPEGKIEDPGQPGVFSQIIILFNSPWQVQFWQGSGYTRIFGGKMVGGLNDEVMKATGAAGDITVLESPVDGLAVSVPEASTSTDIADAVWAAVTRTLTTGTKDSEIDTIVAAVTDILKLTGFKVTRAGDIITIYEIDGVTPWRQYDLSSGGRVQV
jgi:hypothetical protein